MFVDKAKVYLPDGETKHYDKTNKNIGSKEIEVSDKSIKVTEKDGNIIGFVGIPFYYEVKGKGE